MLAFSTAGSLSASHTVQRCAAMRRSPVISIRPNPVVRGGRYFQGRGHATKRACLRPGCTTKPTCNEISGFVEKLPHPVIALRGSHRYFMAYDPAVLAGAADKRGGAPFSGRDT